MGQLDDTTESQPRKARSLARHRGGGGHLVPLMWIVALTAISATVVAQRSGDSRIPPGSRPNTNGSTNSVKQAESRPTSLNRPDRNTQLEALQGEPFLGVAINAHHISRLDWYLESVDHIAEMGANSLILVTPMWMEDVNDSDIYYLPHRCPTDEQLEAILGRAKEHNLRTVLLPIVLLEHTGEKEWRGVIKPDDWDKWWSSYDRFIDRFVGLASRTGVDVLSVGSELNATEAKLDRWVSVIDRIRREYDGLLMYSANWDRFHSVRFWPMLDMIGVSSYFELVKDGEEPTLEPLTQAWIGERDRMLQLAKKFDRPIVLTEMGYPSLSTAARYPWNYVNKSKARANHDMQALCYQSFFDAWAAEVGRPDSYSAGFFCYHWDPYNHGESDDTGYGMGGKPSHEVIVDGFDRIKALLEQEASDDQTPEEIDDQ